MFAVQNWFVSLSCDKSKAGLIAVVIFDIAFLNFSVEQFSCKFRRNTCYCFIFGRFASTFGGRGCSYACKGREAIVQVAAALSQSLRMANNCFNVFNFCIGMQYKTVMNIKNSRTHNRYATFEGKGIKGGSYYAFKRIFDRHNTKLGFSAIYCFVDFVKRRAFD
ncbi:unknown [Eggerthella sp. CAG:1427]|nr:unknown [Eggerthella sp. CAG:1427]